MVFSPVTPFQDHHDCHQQLQQSNHQQESGGVGENLNFWQPLAPPQHGGGGGGGGGGEGSIQLGSMVDQARLANPPLREPGLKCPRCDSTNTKFCYFNNYSLTQPRHFCKTCRRYWTRGGALRNAPVEKEVTKAAETRNLRSRKGAKSISGSPSRCSTENIAS